MSVCNWREIEREREKETWKARLFREIELCGEIVSDMVGQVSAACE